MYCGKVTQSVLPMAVADAHAATSFRVRGAPSSLHGPSQSSSKSQLSSSTGTASDVRSSSTKSASMEETDSASTSLLSRTLSVAALSSISAANTAGSIPRRTANNSSNAIMRMGVFRVINTSCFPGEKHLQAPLHIFLPGLVRLHSGLLLFQFAQHAGSPPFAQFFHHELPEGGI